MAFKSKVATKKNFESIMRERPRVLHISCHGTDTDKKTMGLNYNEKKAKLEKYFLMFENSYGAGDMVSAKQLQDLMN